MDGPHHPPTHPPTHPHQPRLNETGMELMLNGSPGLLPAGEWVPIAPLIGQSPLTSSRPEGSGASGQRRMAPGARPQAPGLNSDSSPFLNLMGWAGSAMLDPCVCVCVCVCVFFFFFRCWEDEGWENWHRCCEFNEQLGYK